MKIQSLNFRLSQVTVKHIEKSTRCSIEELRTCSIFETKELMIKRGAMKESCKIKEWFSDKYKEFGEKFGLLRKEYNIYTDVD